MLIDYLTENTRPSLREMSWCKSEPHAAFVAAALRAAAADPDGRLPPAGNFAALSVYMGMLIVGWVKRRDGRKGGPWLITDDGLRIAHGTEAEGDAP